MTPSTSDSSTSSVLQHSRRLLIALAALSFVIAEAANHFDLASGLNHAYTDLWHRFSGVRFEPKHTALVVVDEESLARYPDDPLVFWPPLFAKAAATLREAGATVIGIDFLFSITPENWLNKLKIPKNDAFRQYDLAFRQELNAGRIVLVSTLARGDPGKPDNLLLPHADYLLSLPNMNLPANVALADLETDHDGTIRRFAMSPAVNLPKDILAGAPTLGFGALMAVRAAGENPVALEWRIGGREYGKASRHFISYAGPPKTIPRVSFQKLLEKDALQDPAVQALKGKVVIIGGDYLGMNDIHSSPYTTTVAGRASTGMPGAEIQANIVETLLSGRSTEPTPHALRWLIEVLVLLLAIHFYLRKSPWIGLSAVAAGYVLSLIIGYISFRQFQLFPAAHLQMALLAAFLMVLGLRLTREEREKTRIRNMFEGYVSDDVVNMLLTSGERPDLNGQTMRVTVLFSDIRNFTTITEKLSAHETVEFLNVYFERVINVILAEGGRIDKFIGDAVMAEFGVPYPFPNHAESALRAAAGIRSVAKEFMGWMHERFPDRGIPEFGIGVGIHTGLAVVGNLGSAKRMEFTAIGDTVNVASRIESETKNLNCVILASAQTVSAANNTAITGRYVTINVKGRMEPVEIYEVLDVKSKT